MTEPTPLTAAEIEGRPWGIATDIDGWLLFRDRALATIDALRTQLEQAKGRIDSWRREFEKVQAKRDAYRTALEEERGKFQRETRRTSELWIKLKEVVENLCPQHGPGSYGRHGCRYCGLLLEIEQLLVKPINEGLQEGYE